MHYIAIKTKNCEKVQFSKKIDFGEFYSCQTSFTWSLRFESWLKSVVILLKSPCTHAEQEMASQRRRNQRLAVVRWLHSFLSCCPSGNCLFPPVKRAEERLKEGTLVWATNTPLFWAPMPCSLIFGLPSLLAAALRNPQPNIRGQPGVITPHLSFSFPQKKTPKWYVLCS